MLVVEVEVEVVNGTGNPRVSPARPVPVYPQEPVPVHAGKGFSGYGNGLSKPAGNVN